jgi:hypothetical protein
MEHTLGNNFESAAAEAAAYCTNEARLAATLLLLPSRNDQNKGG